MIGGNCGIGYGGREAESATVLVLMVGLVYWL